ncbi:hypothetical protein GCM10010327_11100 [Streptomyces nitrosporeus]|nr:hypothetical protein GCM10010327_11100 [Streptomyces nitrosporeus]
MGGDAGGCGAGQGLGKEQSGRQREFHHDDGDGQRAPEPEVAGGQVAGALLDESGDRELVPMSEAVLDVDIGVDELREAETAGSSGRGGG